ncbi:uncharacterized protein LOC131932060 [Physella acuta]|uniref:uncharacterized protein LOC131932060 n=1 Tax=Physella acuta TaxID=109671 RepID=UPI0027DBEB2C|nr:uncharacterized protein LOC131932060 [Physella acuta]
MMSTTRTLVNSTQTAVNVTSTTTESTTPTSSTTTTTTTSTTTPQPSKCPPLNEDNISITFNHTTGVTTTTPTPGKRQIYRLSTNQRTQGTVVKAECPLGARARNTVFLECLGTGQWNTSLPLCTESHDISSYRLYFALGGVVCGIAVLVIFSIYCAVVRAGRRKDLSALSEASQTTERSNYVDPYYVGNRLYGSTNETSDSEITYAKPVVFSTYLNPSFYEDAYDRWKKQEQTNSEKFYDVPWAQQRSLNRQMETPGFKWSQSSLKALGESGFYKIPRAQISDQTSNKSDDSIDKVSNTKSLDPLSRMASVSSEETLHGVKRYRRMKSRKLAGKSGAHAHDWSPDDESDTTEELDGDSCVGLTTL